MNTTDLRIRYKMDTSNYPLLNHSRSELSFTGKLLYELLKYDYVKWLEEKFGGSNKFRYMYHKEYGNNAISSNYFQKKYLKTRIVPEIFSNEYSYWLENYIVENILNNHNRTYIY